MIDAKREGAVDLVGEENTYKDIVIANMNAYLMITTLHSGVLIDYRHLICQRNSNFKTMPSFIS